MRNLNWKAALVVGAALLLPAVQASATISMSLLGNFTLMDDDADGFSELLTFDNPFGGHSGVVTAFDPLSDAIFSDAGFVTVDIAALTLDPDNPFAFDPTTYVDGFAVYDNEGNLLFDSDLAAMTLEIDGGTGDINSSLQLNLSNVSAGPDYTPGDSTIVDTFLSAADGAVNLTLQLPGGDLGQRIQDGEATASTYSGSAYATVPEPSTLALLGSGLLGAAIFGGRRSR